MAVGSLPWRGQVLQSLEIDKSMHVRVRYSEDHARAQDLKKEEHETEKKRARKLCKLTVIRKMCKDLSRTV